ncbi:MAG TPA: hypothetical protein VL866_20490 [Pyrinomonadaceae bacterium]|nr:hypothetical protein [Pyrinomonadaceae bacterium]
MKTYLQIFRFGLIVLTVATIFIFRDQIASGQESQESSAPRVELLTMNDSKPNLSATGEGITSYKIGDLYNRGSTRITLLKAAEARFKIELPIGYSVFNNLVYVVETNAVFTGPTDITFKLPSASTKETFNQLRVLYARHDLADPNVPKWIDATFANDVLQHARGWLSEAEIKQRLRDFGTRTLHAVTPEDEPLVMIVALLDPTKVRDKMTADLVVNGTATEQVTEGRSVTYELKITNKGPDAASAISLHTTPSFSFVSVNASAGKCSMAGQNVYCKFPELKKDRTIEVKIVERCGWKHHFPNGPPGYETPTTMVRKVITVGATEHDPFVENNELNLTTEVFPDSNKAPTIEILSPTLFQQFQGPKAAVPLRFKASDPDGFIKTVELFTHSMQSLPLKSLGEPTLQSDGEYELIYKDAPFGRNWVLIVATDNLGRVETAEAPEFFINGTSRVEIINPKAGDKLSLVDGEFAVTIHASNPTGSLKKVSLDVWNSDATAIGNDDYVVKLNFCYRRCRLQAIAIDENGVETRSDYVEFTMMKPPSAALRWFDGEYSRELEAGKPFKVSELILLACADHPDVGNDAKISKLEIFANGFRVCIDDSPVLGFGGECIWKPSPGKYKLQTVATDEDGAVGKSDEIEIVIERP